mgnify:CR=1 FL=1
MKSTITNNHDQIATHLFRESSGKMVAYLSKRYGLNQLENIMDAVQETFESALRHWRYKGIPDKPEAYLITTAKNKLLNIIKRDQLSQDIESSLVSDRFSLPNEAEIDDNQMQLLFFICSLELPSKSQIIFTLYALCGFGTPEIANALLMSNEAVKKNLFRSKQTIKQQYLGNRFFSRCPKDTDQLNVILYLIFNEGYKTTRSKEGLNIDLCYEAIRLGKLLLLQVPESGETSALLALMFFNISRFPARVSIENNWISLQQQDRSLWNPIYIKEGFYYLRKARSSTHLSKYHIEATIASLHSAAKSFETTKWTKIIHLYEQLEQIEGVSFSLKLNQIIATSYIAPSANLLKELELLKSGSKQENLFYFYLAKAHLLQSNHWHTAAAENYQIAYHHAQSEIDKQFILQKIDDIQQVIKPN